MERIAEIICEYIRPNSILTLDDVTQPHLGVAPDNVIVRPSAVNEMWECRELTLNVSKRVKSKSNESNTIPMLPLVIIVIASIGYTVNAANFESLSNDDVASVWKFIDKAKTTLSIHPREMLCRLLGPRTSSGFALSIGARDTPTKSSGSGVPFTGSEAVQSAVRVADYDSTHGRDTFSEAMIADLAAVCLADDDPEDALTSTLLEISRRAK